MLAAILAVALAVRLVNLGAPSFWVDEIYSLRVAMRDLGGVLADRDQTPPLYVLFLHFWIRLFGISEFAVRLPSVLFGTAAVAMVYPLARRFSDGRAALLATAIMALGIYHIATSQDARAYSLFLLLCLASAYTFLRLSDGFTWARGVWYVLVTTLMLYTHVFGLFFLLAQQAYVLATQDPMPWLSRRWVLLQAAAGLLFLPWVGILVQRLGVVSSGFWIATPGFETLTWTAVVFAGSKWLAYAFAALLVWVALARWRHAAASPQHERRKLLFLGMWLAIPVLIPMLISQRIAIYTPRYALPAAVGLVVLASMAVMEVRSRSARRVVTLGVAGLALLACFGFFAGGQMEDYKQGWREAVDVIEPAATPGATILFNTGYCDSSTDLDLQCAYEYYSNRPDLDLVPFLPSGPVRSADIPALDAVVANATQVWVIYGFVTDSEGVIKTRLSEQFEHTGHWTPKHLVVDRYDRIMPDATG